ncbi:C-1-tetrahydrofolate synthase, cytoplasmic [Halotydeus destructor]|nr:C-1-tetrahydrofolate synthase, cytoplasmic [Halotydeus destructor]
MYTRTWSLTARKLNIVSPVPSDIDVVRAHQCKKIDVLAAEIGLSETEYEPYGHYKGKITKKVPELNGSRGNYIVVTGINPTPLGEGKSTTVIGLAQCLGATLGKNAIACIRQPSQGPTFGIKGGAAGGGYSQVIPMEDFNLHLTGDIHAITAANNLIAAAIDARAFHESSQSDKALYARLVPVTNGKREFTKSQKTRLAKLGIPVDLRPDELTLDQIRDFSRLNINFDSLNWNRVVDVNDRFLRKITIGQSATEKNCSRQTQYDISVASELMAILALCEDLRDARIRIGRIVVGQSKDNVPKPITCEDLNIAGAVTVLLKDAIKPNLVQTLEGTPVLVHCGPFANIAHGNSSVIADKLALDLVGRDGYVLTEAGFGADVGLEKFVHIKSRASGIMPDCVVIVATVRALKTHGGGPQVVPGAKLPKEYTQEDLNLLKNGLSNLRKHVENITRKFNLPLVVAINKFSTDSDKELEMIKKCSLEAGADAACVTDHFTKGGEGAVELASAIMDVCKTNSKKGRFIYNLNCSIKEKIEAVVKEIYGGNGVEYSEKAAEKIEQYEQLGYGKFPICIAKTQYSFSHDAKLKGSPTGFKFPIIDVRVSVGAGFVYPLAGEIQTMPGLPTRPAYFDIDIDPETERIEGLF